MAAHTPATSPLSSTPRLRASAPWLLGALLVAGAGLLAGAPAQAQQVYRIVGPDGKVTFSDRPPEKPDAKVATVRGGGSQAEANSTLPAELRRIANQYPVTLYVTRDCDVCNAGRQLLVGRGIPFAEKTISSNADIAALKRLTGSDSLPSLSIGSQSLRGLQEGEWNSYLDAAGYPAQIPLPATYRRPSPEPLVPGGDAPAKQPSEAKPKAKPQPDLPVVPRRATEHNPAGLQF
ncbi:MAG: glutaredoxin family protein [Curvibacter sp.]|nr:MAG: glutaredoxin family protein [Curvibacter sp.]